MRKKSFSESVRTSEHRTNAGPLRTHGLTWRGEDCLIASSEEGRPERGQWRKGHRRPDERQQENDTRDAARHGCGGGHRGRGRAAELETFL
eukprot:424509-Rhodomonas_salina.1